MDAVELDTVIWVGHSMGGAISITAGLRRPDRVAGLVLVGTGGRLRVHPTILEGTKVEGATPEVVDMIMGWAFSANAEPKLVSLAATRMVEIPAKVMHGDFLACDRFDVLEELGSITASTVVICGTADRLTPVKYSEKLVEDIPNASLELIEDAGHMVMLEQPELVQETVRIFIKENFTGTEGRST
jgi:pimeloyl-ACP methyl ester carboxylesterase